MTVVCTGFHPQGHELYGKRFLETFDLYWPPDVRLLYYVEQPAPSPRGSCVSLWECDGVADFIARHKDDPEKCCAKPNARWRPKYIARGYNFRFDAVKFCRQLFIPEHAARGLADGEVLAWLDADVVTLRRVPDGFLERQLGDAELCYLGRRRIYPEIGFWAVRLNPRTRAFLKALGDAYRSDRVFSFSEWHSAFVWDAVRLEQKGLCSRNLTPDGAGHVWFQAEVGRFTDHLKGSRKLAGFSPERR